MHNKIEELKNKLNSIGFTEYSTHYFVKGTIHIKVNINYPDYKMVIAKYGENDMQTSFLAIKDITYLNRIQKDIKFLEKREI